MKRGVLKANGLAVADVTISFIKQEIEARAGLVGADGVTYAWTPPFRSPSKRTRDLVAALQRSIENDMAVVYFSRNDAGAFEPDDVPPDEDVELSGTELLDDVMPRGIGEHATGKLLEQEVTWRTWRCSSSAELCGWLSYPRSLNGA